MRCMYQPILITSRRRLYRAELEFAPFVRGNSAKSSGNFFTTCVRIFSDTSPRRFTGLPDFQHRIRHGLAVTVQNPPANYHALPFCSPALNLFPAQLGKPNREKGPDRLRRRRYLTHFTFPSASRRARATQYRIDSLARIPESSSPGQMTKSVVALLFRRGCSCRWDRAPVADPRGNTSASPTCLTIHRQKLKNECAQGAKRWRGCSRDTRPA